MVKAGSSVVGFTSLSISVASLGRSDSEKGTAVGVGGGVAVAATGVNAVSGTGVKVEVGAGVGLSVGVEVASCPQAAASTSEAAAKIPRDSLWSKNKSPPTFYVA
jgi:hypothetical protein